jgi:hypothetical protein
LGLESYHSLAKHVNRPKGLRTPPMTDTISVAAAGVGLEPKLRLRDLDEVQRVFREKGWTDGLPVIPPTAERVGAMLSAAGMAAEREIGEIRERHRTVTAEKLAANAVMAGCAPEHFPVLVAIWECFMDPAACIHTASASTSGSAPLAIVNGPVVHKLGFRTGANVFGPGNHANASLGRAVRLVLINLVGATEELDRGCTGHPGKYSYLIAEDEDEAWEPIHVGKGLARDDSAVTILHAEGPHHVRESAANSPEALLSNYADHVRSWNHGATGVLVINAEHRRLLQDHGWSKADVSAFVYENCWRTVADLKRAGKIAGVLSAEDETTRFRFARGPQEFLVVAAGGHGAFAAVVPAWSGAAHSGHVPVTRKILPRLAGAVA